MTFETFENSTEAGRPLRLYVFSLGNSVWRYTSADEDITITLPPEEEGGDPIILVYKAVVIADSGVKLTGEATTDAMTINASSNIAPGQVYMGTPPTQTMWVEIWDKHEGDAEFLIRYHGEVSQVNYPMPGKCIVTCETLSASLNREGLRLGWSRTCPYAVYDQNTCKATKVQVPITVLGVNGLAVIVDGIDTFDLGYFNGGILEWEDPYRGLEARLVEFSEDSTLTMFGTADGINVGMIATVARGCRQTAESCQELSNYDNYGGFPAMPGKSPFDGNPVF